MDLRCTSKKHAVLIQPTHDEGLVEVRCSSRWCGAGPGVVVVHQFSTVDGRLTTTSKFRSAPTEMEGTT